jgi:phosphatidylethanolamine/phosphatidyl-N-methylethanolamine N-methyltransferase
MSKKEQIAAPTRLQAVRAFAWSLIKNPLMVGAAAASGQELAKLITSEISAEDGPVLEIGAGTGSLTYALLAKGVSEDQLVLVDHGLEFAKLLQLRFPRARILRCDAARLDKFPDLPMFGAAISGLPLTIIAPDKYRTILQHAFSLMRPGARFYQFTYSHRCPFRTDDLRLLNLKATSIGTSWRNVPPATVYRLQKNLDES